MKGGIKIIRLTSKNFFMVHGLRDESTRAGYEFIKRLVDDWNSRTNQFSGSGERLWGLFLGPVLIGVAGLNRDPYMEEPSVGRVRHLYILEAHRRKGYATLLMDTLLQRAQQHFAMLRLYTDNADAAMFYEKLGFQKITSFKASHQLVLPGKLPGKQAWPV
jgi:GNAT superfamily N-acetyltransferase